MTTYSITNNFDNELNCLAKKIMKPIFAYGFVISAISFLASFLFGVVLLMAIVITAAPLSVWLAAAGVFAVLVTIGGLSFAGIEMFDSACVKSFFVDKLSWILENGALLIHKLGIKHFAGIEEIVDVELQSVRQGDSVKGTVQNTIKDYNKNLNNNDNGATNNKNPNIEGNKKLTLLPSKNFSNDNGNGSLSNPLPNEMLNRKTEANRRKSI